MSLALLIGLSGCARLEGTVLGLRPQDAGLPPDGAADGAIDGTVDGAGDAAPADDDGGTCFAQVSGGEGATCVRTRADSAYCYGSNDRGQLGNGTVGGNLPPTPVDNLETGVAQVASGLGFACARKTDGTAWCWGLANGATGQLGNGTTAGSATPVLVPGLGGTVVEIAAGGAVACARTADQIVHCWGDNTGGAVGKGAKSGIEAPVALTTLGPAKQICVGVNHACALKPDGTVWCWGRNDKGQALDGSIFDQPAPARAATPVTFDSVACGHEHTCGVRTDRLLSCWGRNDSGQLGNHSYIGGLAATPVPDLANVEQVTAGASHTCALLSDRTVWCWGSNETGALGNDQLATSHNAPVQIERLRGEVEAINAGATHNCVLMTGGALWCWGDNLFGQLAGHPPPLGAAIVPLPVRVGCVGDTPTIG